MKTWQVIWRLIRFVPQESVINIFGIIILFLGFQIPAFALREFFNLISGDAPARLSFSSILAVLVAAWVGKMVANVMLVRSNIPLQYKIAALLQRNMFLHIFKQPGACALPNSPGESISRFRGDVQEVFFFPIRVNDTIGACVGAIIAAIAMLRINSTITAVSFLPMILVVGLVHAATERLERYRKANREATGYVTGFVGETFGAVQAVKVATAEEHVITHFRKLNDQRCKMALKDRLFEELMDSVFFNAINLGTGAILILSAQLIQDGGFTVGDLALFIYMLE